MARIFVSHSSKEAGQVSFLVEALKASGHSVIFTSEFDTGLPATEEWLDTIEEGVKSADLIIFWITEYWIQSCWCRVEFVFARKFAIQTVFFKDPKVTFDLIASKQVYSTHLGQDLVISVSKAFVGEKATIVEGVDPYPGFSAFDESLSHFFFGRTDATKNLVCWALAYKKDIKGHKPFRALTGASGVGKTSLLRAGLHAALVGREDIIEVELVKEERRFWSKKTPKAVRKKQHNLRIATAFDRSESPRQCVRRCLVTLLEIANQPETDDVDIKSLQDAVIARYAGTRSDYNLAKGIIMIDAFERFYHGGDDEARNALRAVATNARINVVFTIRSSYIPQLIDDPILSKVTLAEHICDIDTERFRDIIELPAERCGWSVEVSLTNLLSAYFREHPQSLPLIAYIMRSIWRAREIDEDALRKRILSTTILSKLAAVPQHNAAVAIDHLIEELCKEIESRLSPQLIESLEKLLFRMCRWDTSGIEVSSLGCRLREEDKAERELVDLLCSSEYRLFVVEKKVRENSIIVSAAHDRILRIWKRARETLDTLKPEMVLLSVIEQELRPIKGVDGFIAWMESKTQQRKDEVVSFFERWFESLSDELHDFWTGYRKRVLDEERSTAKTKKLLQALGASRAIGAGILSDLMFAENDPCQAVQIALAAQEPSSKGHPYKAVTTAILRGLHEMREISIWRSNRVKGIGNSRWLFGGSWDEKSRTVSAFTGSSRIVWSPQGEATTIDILPKNHRAILTLTDGGWGCVISTRKDGNGRYLETEVRLHHVRSDNPLRFKFGRKRILAGAMFESGEWLSLAIAWQEENDRDGEGHTPQPCSLGLCRLHKESLFELSHVSEYHEFLPVEKDNHDWSGFEINALAWAGAGPRLFVGGGKEGHLGGYGQVWDVGVSSDGIVLRGLSKEIGGVHKGAITGAAISRDGQLLVTGGSNGRAAICDLRCDTRNNAPRILRGADRGGLGDDRAHDGSVEIVALSRDGLKAFTASTDTSIKMWDTITGHKLSEMKGHSARITDLQASNDGKRLYSFSNDGTARCWDIAAKAPVSKPIILSDRPTFLTYCADGEILCCDSSGKLWLGKRNGQASLLCDFAFRVISGSTLTTEPVYLKLPTVCVVGEAYLGVFDLKTGTHLCMPLPPILAGRQPTAVSICRLDKYQAAIGLSDGRLLTLSRNEQGRYELNSTSIGLKTSIGSLTALQNRRIICGRSDGMISLLSEHFEIIDTREASKYDRGRVRASIDIPSLGLIATAGASGRKYPIILWETDLKGIHDTLWGHTAPIEALALLQDGRTLVSAGRDCTVRFWDVVGRVELGAIRAFPDWATRLAVSPAGDVIAVGGADDRSVREWGAAPVHYHSTNWQTAPDEHYSKPAFKDAMEKIEELRPEGLPVRTLRRYFFVMPGEDQGREPRAL